MVTLHPRGILFDMDGVLVDSIGSVERTWEKWAKARGINPALAIQTAHGRRAIETVRMLRPDLNDMEELAWLERMEIADNGELAIFASIERILEKLPENTGPSSPRPPSPSRAAAWSTADSACPRTSYLPTK